MTPQFRGFHKLLSLYNGKFCHKVLDRRRPQIIIWSQSDHKTIGSGRNTVSVKIKAFLSCLYAMRSGNAALAVETKIVLICSEGKTIPFPILQSLNRNCAGVKGVLCIRRILYRICDFDIRAEVFLVTLSMYLLPLKSFTKCISKFKACTTCSSAVFSFLNTPARSIELRSAVTKSGNVLAW